MVACAAEGVTALDPRARRRAPPAELHSRRTCFAPADRAQNMAATPVAKKAGKTPQEFMGTQPRSGLIVLR